MDVILLERIEKLGVIGDVVKVKNGYARNFLLPRGKALRANESNRKVFEANREKIEATNAERRTEAEKDVKIALHPEVAVTISVNVARSPEEAELQAQGKDVMAEMFEKDVSGFVEERAEGLEPGETAPEPAEAPQPAETPATAE